MTPLQIKKIIINTLDEHKATDIISLDVRKLTDFTDHMIICSATSTRHISALASHVVTKVKEAKTRPLGTEGDDGIQDWALIDFGFIIVHIMLPTAREFYGLEKMWSSINNVTKVPEKAAIVNKAAAPRAVKKSLQPKAKAAIKKPTTKKAPAEKKSANKTSPKKPAVKKATKKLITAKKTTTLKKKTTK